MYIRKVSGIQMVGIHFPTSVFFLMQLYHDCTRRISINRLITVMSFKTGLNHFWYCSHLNTGPVWYLNGRFVSGCQMVQYSNGGLKTGLKKNLFMVQNIWHSNGLPSLMTLPFEYRTPILTGIRMVTVLTILVFFQ